MAIKRHPAVGLWVVLVLVLAEVGQMQGQNTQQVTKTSTYSVVHGWPVLPDGYVLGQVSGVAVDSHDHVFIFHRADSPSFSGQEWHRVIAPATVLCFEGATGNLLASWGVKHFVVPHGLRIDREDNVWLTDVALHQVFKFSHDGKLLMTLGTKGEPGQDGGHFNRPTDIAIAPDGTIYVSDGYGNSRVAKFSGDGKFLLDWGRRGEGPGEFNIPHGIALDSQERVYVADRSNGRIQVFQPDGKFLNEWKSADLGRSWAVTMGPDGYLYVVDGGDLKPAPPDRGRVLKLDLNGNIVDKWSSYGNYDGQIYWGHDIAVGRNGAVYVGDVYFGMRVQKFVRK
jgi:peptidylamidoglycolate lyase